MQDRTELDTAVTTMRTPSGSVGVAAAPDISACKIPRKACGRVTSPTTPSSAQRLFAMNHAEDADLTTVKGLSPLLSAAISEARKYGKLTGRVSDGELHYSLNANRAKQHAVAEEWNGAPFWTCSTSQAEIRRLLSARSMRRAPRS